MLSYVPNELNSLQFIPSQSFVVSPSWTTLTQTFQISASTSGTFNITVATGPTAVCSEKIYPANFTLQVRPSNIPPPAPSIVSAILANDGSYASVTFSFGTDKAGTAINIYYIYNKKLTVFYSH